MSAIPGRLQAVVEEIDALNAQDARRDVVCGREVPRELLYAERLSAALLALYPEASELLRIAARGQHVRRWDIPRDSYPLGRSGYNAWRTACREHHATLVGEVMGRHGYSGDEVVQVQDVIRKKNLKTNAESQALENAVALVFVTHYLDDFVAAHPDYDDAKLAGILAKTFRKADQVGVEAVKKLDLPQATRALIERALA